MANSDFFMVDAPQYIHPWKNDEGRDGHAWRHAGGPAEPWISSPCGGPPFVTTCHYANPPSNTLGFSYYQYQYYACCGNPPGPDSNIGTVALLLIPRDDAQNAGDSCPVVGKPVNITNGNMWLQHSDYILPGRGDIIEINRFYNSIIQSNGLFGFGWSTKYDESIVLYGDKMIRLNQADGQAAYFGRQETTDPYKSFSPGIVGQFVQNVNGTFSFTRKDGTLKAFNSLGRLVSTTDRNGNTTSLTYDTSGRLTAITDASGRIITVTPNTNGTVAQISDSLGAIADYEYFPNTTLLKTVTKPDGSKYKFEYVYKVVNGQARTYLATVKDALANIVETHEYDNQGRATTSEIHGGAEKYTITYDLAHPAYGIYTRVTDALGRVTDFYHYRIYGQNLVHRTEGSCSSCGGGGSETTTFQFDTGNSFLNLEKKTDALGRDTTYKYDDNQNVIEETDIYGTQKWTYNTFGQVLTYKDRVDSQATNANTVVMTYDSNGNPKTYTDALAKVTTLEYPTTGNVGLPESIRDARNNITKFKWFNSGLLEESEDPYTKKTKFTYDARGRTKTITNALNHVTQYNYFDDTQRKVEIIYPNLDKITYRYDIRRLLESVTDERGNLTGYEFDPQYRLKKITDPLGHVKEFGYDLMSNRTSYKDPLGNETNYVFDDFNRLKEITHPAAVTGGARLTEKFEYDKLGRIKKYTDTANRFTQYAYNDTTRTNTVTDAANKVTTTKYNQRFQTIEVKDAINQVYTFGYDPLGRLLSQTRAGGTMSFVYDAVGNREKRTDYAGRVTDYTYDNLNRLKKIEYDPGAGNSVDKPQSTYNYDDISRLTSAVNDVGTVSFNYDSRNRMINTTDVFGRLIEYEYERTATVNQKRLKFDGAMYAVYNFDDAGRLANIVNSPDTTTITFGYDNEDKIISRVYPNGVTTTYDYYNNDLLKRLKDVNTAGTLFDRQYTYNSANQIDSIVELTGTRVFGYDLVDRLKTVHTNGTQTEFYNFDDVGNRISSHLSTSYGYQTEKFNQLASTATTSYQFDANGNTVRKSEGSSFWRYIWDYENRLTQASTRKQNVRYRYDALGRRVERSLGFGKERTKFTHDGLDVLVDDDAGTLTKYLNGLSIDNKLRIQNGGNVSYFIADHLGSTNGLTDQTGIVTSQTAYDSFGNQTGSIVSRYGFTGRERDDFSGHIYYRARFYAPSIGRFASEDPIGFRGGDINLYGYVRNQPLWFRDPMGLQPGGDIMNPGAWREFARAMATLGSAAGAVGAAVPAAPVAVAAGGAVAIYGASKVGEYTAGHPSNPFVYGPLNPWGNPAYPGSRPFPPVTVSPTSQPFCKPMRRTFPFPRAVPFEYAPSTPWPSDPEDDPDDERCRPQFDADNAICRSLPKPADRAACFSQAMERYGNCLAGRPQPPFPW